MKEHNYKFAILAEMQQACNKFPDYTFGEILHEIIRGTKKTCLTATDEEIYTSLEKVLNTNIEDEPMTAEDFKSWTDGK